MSSSSVFSNRLLRSRSLLQRYAGSHNVAPAVACSSGEVGSINKRISRSSHHITSTQSHLRRPLSIQTMQSPEHSQQQQGRLKQRHDRQRAFSSTAEESSFDEDGEETKASALSSKPDIDPEEVESKRRKVKDVSVMIRSGFLSASFDFETNFSCFGSISSHFNLSFHSTLYRSRNLQKYQQVPIREVLDVSFFLCY